MKRFLFAVLSAIALEAAATPASAITIQGAAELGNTNFVWTMQNEMRCHAGEGGHVAPLDRVRACTVLIKWAHQRDATLVRDYLDRAHALVELGDNKDAQKDFDFLVRNLPDNPDFRFARADFYGLMNKIPQARADLDKGFALTDMWLGKEKDPKVKAGFLNDRCYARAKWEFDLKAALADCNAALVLEPNYVYVLDSRAFVEFRLGEYVQAIADANAALEQRPKAATTLYVRGLAEKKSGDAADSATDIAKAKKIDTRIVYTFATYGVAP